MPPLAIFNAREVPTIAGYQEDIYWQDAIRVEDIIPLFGSCSSPGTAWGHGLRFYSLQTGSGGARDDTQSAIREDRWQSGPAPGNVDAVLEQPYGVPESDQGRLPVSVESERMFQPQPPILLLEAVQERPEIATRARIGRPVRAAQ